MCNCKLTEIVLGVIILLFAVWDWGIDPRFSKWIVGIAAVLLILHASTASLNFIILVSFQLKSLQGSWPFYKGLAHPSPPFLHGTCQVVCPGTGRAFSSPCRRGCGEGFPPSPPKGHGTTRAVPVGFYWHCSCKLRLGLFFEGLRVQDVGDVEGCGGRLRGLGFGVWAVGRCDEGSWGFP